MTKELGNAATVGFTVMQRWLTFSPAKNSLAEAVAATQKGAPAGSPASAEAEYYAAFRSMLSTAGNMHFEQASPQSFGGVEVTLMPSVVLDQHFALTTDDLAAKVQGGTVTARSSLVVEGAGVKLANLQLDGALVVKATNGAKLSVNGLQVKNKGWRFQAVDPSDASIAETIRMRGYELVKEETKEIVVNGPGQFEVDESGVVKEVVLTQLRPGLWDGKQVLSPFWSLAVRSLCNLSVPPLCVCAVVLGPVS